MSLRNFQLSALKRERDDFRAALAREIASHKATIERLEAVAAGRWIPLSERHPEPHCQVLVRLREGAGGFVCDVACYAGRQPDGERRWILADVRLESRQIVAWAEIIDPNKNRL